MKYVTFKIFNYFVSFFSTLKEILSFLSVTVSVKMTRLRSLFTHLELILNLVLYKTVSFFGLLKQIYCFYSFELVLLE